MKKLLSALLCGCMLFSTAVSIGATAEMIYDDTYTLGDVNRDGAVNAKDTYAIAETVAQNAQNECDSNAADIDADGKVSARDAFYLKASFAGAIELSDYDSDKQIYKFTVADNDVSEYKICVPVGTVSDDNIAFAAEILQKYIRIATDGDVALEIVYGDTYSNAFVFHHVEYDSEEGEKLGRDGYIFEVKDGNVNMYGTFRGNMYAVYDMIEKYLGIRFFNDNCIYMYRTRRVDIPEGTYSFVRPLTPIRGVRSHMANVEEYALAMHINNTDVSKSTDTRRGTFEGSQFINAHSYGYYWQMATGTGEGDPSDYTYWDAKYNSGEKKPELTWQPCASDESQYDILFQGLLDTISKLRTWYPAYDFTQEMIAKDLISMSFSCNDSMNYCSCQWCAAKAKGTTVKNRNQNLVSKGTWRYDGVYTIEAATSGNRLNTTFKKEGYSGVYVSLANRACEDIQEYYPGLRLHSILYDHSIPETVRPNKMLNVWYCGFGCNNHYLGSGECTPTGGNLNYPDGSKRNNLVDEPSLKAWGQFCKESGARLWFWYYPTTYSFLFAGCPNLFNIYYDYKYLVEECGVYNLFYEGGGEPYNFESLKSYLAAKMAWEPEMSFDRYVGYMKEYLYMMYGDGYEDLYEYILHLEEAGNATGCFITNYDRPGDMYSLPYLAEHYEEMRELLVTALSKAERQMSRDKIEILIALCDFMGLSAVHGEWYKNGTAEQKAHYEQRYTDMFNFMHEKQLVPYGDPSVYHLPETISFDETPLVQVYEDGSRRPDSAWN